MTRKTIAVRAVAVATMLPLLIAVSACTPADSAKVATDEVAVTHSENDRVPDGASWTQHYFPSSDGSDVELHSDVLLPEGLAEGEKVPVILSVGAYFGHSGESGVEDHEHTGPSNRFDDLIEGHRPLRQGVCLRHGRSSRIRRLHRMPRFHGTGRAGRR